MSASLLRTTAQRAFNSKLSVRGFASAQAAVQPETVLKSEFFF